MWRRVPPVPLRCYGPEINKSNNSLSADEYHDIAKQYEKKYNNVKIWDSEYLIKNNNYLNLIQWQKK